MNSQTSSIQTNAESNKTIAESVENISAMKRLLKIKTYKMTFRQKSLVVSRKPHGLSTHRGSTSSEELGSMSKNKEGLLWVYGLYQGFTLLP